MKKFLFFAFILIISACASLQVTEETDCCLPVDLTLPVPTETPISTATEVLYPNLSPEKIATSFAIETKIAEYPSICNRPTLFQSDRLSPNGLWREEFCEIGIENKQVLTISNRETKVLWKFFFIDYVPRQSGEGWMSVLHWSKDNRYAFFNAYSTGSGGQCFARRGSQEGYGLFRLDLQTGQVTEILPVFKDRYTYYSFSISPTGRRLTYGAGNLKILDITTGESIDVINIKEFDDRGGYVWSQDGLYFIYSTVIYSLDYSEKDYTVRLVDAKTGIEQILLESSQVCLRAVEWIDANKVRIQKDYEGESFEFDLITNTIISETTINP